jgi:hypothetical protein
MSLKAFHLVFVTALTALTFGCGAWKLSDFCGPHGMKSDLAFALGSFATGVAVLIYGKMFLKKLKKYSYL